MMSGALQPDTLPVVNGFLLILNTLVALAVYFGPKLLDAVGGATGDSTGSGSNLVSEVQSGLASSYGDRRSQSTPIREYRNAQAGQQQVRDEEESTSSEQQEESDKGPSHRNASRLGFDGTIQTHNLGGKS